MILCRWLEADPGYIQDLMIADSGRAVENEGCDCDMRLVVTK